VTRLRAATLLVSVLALLALAGPGTAVAQSAQIDRLIEGPQIQGDNAPTVAERYPVTHYRYPFHGDGIGFGSRSSELLDQTLNAIASLLMLGAGLLAQAASKLMQWAFDPSTTSWLLDAVESTVAALGSTIYGQGVLVAAMLGALWVAWQGIAQRQATSAFQGGIWMVAVIAVGVAFLAQPRWFIETPHEVTTELSASLFGAVAGVGVNASGEGYHGEHPPTYSGPASIDAQRQLEDQLWRVMVFEPWRISTFPNAELADEYGEQLLEDRSEENVQEIYEELEREDPDAAEFFAGREPLDRLVASGMTLVAALPIAITMIVLGAALIVLQFAFVILSLLAPVFLLLGIHPGGGRNALLRWVDMWLGTLVKRVAITALISVLVALFAFAAANFGRQGWYLTVLLTTLVCVAALVYRKTITELLASSAGTVGSGAEGEREHRARAHPLQTAKATTASATRTLKFMSAGALMQRAVRGGGSDRAAGHARGAGDSAARGDADRRPTPRGSRDSHRADGADEESATTTPPRMRRPQDTAAEPAGEDGHTDDGSAPKDHARSRLPSRRRADSTPGASTQAPTTADHARRRPTTANHQDSAPQRGGSRRPSSSPPATSGAESRTPIQRRRTRTRAER